MNRPLIAGAFALAALASGSAFSQTYVGAGIGASHADHACGAADATGLDGSCDKNHFTGKIYGGYTLPGTDFAGELTYANLGSFKASSADGNATARGQYWGLGAAYRPYFGSGWGGVARLGEAYGHGKVDYSIADTHGERTMTDWHPYYGLGVNYALTKNVKLEADWDNTRLTTQVPGYSSSANTVNSYTLGASFGF